MQVIRTISKVMENRVVIDLPEDFYGKEVEIIVIPWKSESIPSLEDGNEWKKDFLSISQWDITEEEIRIKSWPIERF